MDGQKSRAKTIILKRETGVECSGLKLPLQNGVVENFKQKNKGRGAAQRMCFWNTKH